LLAADGEEAAEAAARLLRPGPPHAALHPSVIFACKRAVRAATAAQEEKEFVGLWGSGAHAAAFEAVLSKKKPVNAQ
jgi:hypothetical protein